MSSSSVFFSIMLWITVIVFTVSSAPIPSDQQDIADFSNSNKGAANVFLPFRELPERLIDDFSSRELDDGRDLPSESDIMYFFQTTRITPEIIDARKRGGF